MKENKLIIELKNGNPNAFEELYSLYSKKLLDLAYFYMKDFGEAQDAVQETFVKAYKAIQGFRQESEIYTWLYRICINICNSRLKRWKRKFFRGIVSIFSGEQIKDFSLESFPELMVIRKQEISDLYRAVLNLEEKYRIPLMLKDFQQMSLREIAEILETEEQNVKNWIFRARKKIREELLKNG